MLPGDDRSEWDSELLSDERVLQYWDADRRLGMWFPQQPEYEDRIFGPLAWDIYFLYGPGANWDEAPGPIVVSGSTVISKSGDLAEGLAGLLDGS